MSEPRTKAGRALLDLLLWPRLPVADMVASLPERIAAIEAEAAAPHDEEDLFDPDPAYDLMDES